MNINISSFPSNSQNNRLYCQEALPRENISDIVLQQLYGYPFAQNFMLEEEGEQLQAAVMHIENWMEEREFTLPRISLVRQTVKAILDAPQNFEDKMADLGVFLYELDKHFSLESLNVEVWTFETLKDSLVNSRKGQKTDAEYLRKFFSRLVLFSDERINVGGIYAVLKLLNEELRPKFQEEDLEQIRKFLKELIVNKNFRNRFEEPIAIHESMKLYAAAELEAEVDTIDSFDIKLMILYSFWEIPRQTEQNCYAVASLIYALYHQPCDVLAKMLDVARLGGFYYEGNQFISVEMLVRNRYIVGAEAFFHTALVAGAEFQEINFRSSNVPGTSPRQDVLNFIMDRLRAAFLEPLKFFVPKTREKFFQNLLLQLQTLWLMDQNYSDLYLENDQIKRQNICVLDLTYFAGDRNEMLKLLTNFRMVGHITSTEFKWLQTYDDFKEFLKINIINAASCIPGDKLEFFYFVDMYFDSQKWNTEMTNFLREENDALPSLANCYDALKFFLLFQNGGKEEHRRFFNLSVKEQSFAATSAADAVFALLRWTFEKKEISEFLDRNNAPFLAVNRSHIFNIWPSRFKVLNIQGFYGLANGLVTQQVAENSSSIFITSEKIRRMANLVDIRSKLLPKFASEGENPRRVCETLKKQFHKKSEFLDEALNQAMEEISLERIANSDVVSFTVHKMALKVSSEQIDAIRRQFLAFLHNKGTHFNAYQISKYFMRAFLENKIYNVERNIIEACVAECLKLPFTLEIGDTNSSSEKKKNYMSLVLKYDFYAEGLMITSRSKKGLIVGEEKQKRFQKLKIYYPAHIG